MRRRRWRFALPGAFLLVAAAAAPAYAQKAAAPDPAAVALFDEGRSLMAAGKLAEACPKFEQSVKISRTVGGLLNLADCYEQLGKSASAWAAFRDAEGFARDNKDPRYKVAGERAAALEAKLVKLTVSVAPGADSPDLTVKRDGVAMPRAEWGTALPIDPGTHAIEASAANKQTWSKSVDVGKDGATVTVPVLTAQAPPAPTTGGVTQASGSIKVEPAKSSGSTQRTLGIVAGGVGVAAIAVGTVGGLLAMSNHNSATAACPTYPVHCNPDHSADGPNSTSQTWATVSTVAFIVAGAAVATGTVLFLTAPKKQAAPSLGLHVAPAAGPSAAGLVVGGNW